MNHPRPFYQQDQNCSCFADALSPSCQWGQSNGRGTGRGYNDASNNSLSYYCSSLGGNQLQQQHLCNYQLQQPVNSFNNGHSPTRQHVATQQHNMSPSVTSFKQTPDSHVQYQQQVQCQPQRQYACSSVSSQHQYSHSVWSMSPLIQLENHVPVLKPAIVNISSWSGNLLAHGGTSAFQGNARQGQLVPGKQWTPSVGIVRRSQSVAERQVLHGLQVQQPQDTNKVVQPATLAIEKFMAPPCIQQTPVMSARVFGALMAAVDRSLQQPAENRQIQPKMKRQTKTASTRQERSGKGYHISRPMHNPAAIKILKDWYDANAPNTYADQTTAERLAAETKLSVEAVRKWIYNTRFREGQSRSRNGKNLVKRIA